MRLDKDPPANIALEEFQRKVKKPRRKQKTTWVKYANEDLSSLNLPPLDSAEVMCILKDRDHWRVLIAEVQTLPKA